MADWKDISDELGRKFELVLADGLCLLLSESPQTPAKPWRLACGDWFVALPIADRDLEDAQRTAVIRVYARLIAAIAELFQNIQESEKAGVVDMLTALVQSLAAGAKPFIVFTKDPPPMSAVRD